MKKCAVHLVAAVVFRESSRVASMEAGAHTLACIGSYYAGFHSAVAALWITESVHPNSLQRVGHKNLRKLIEENLKQTRRIKASFMNDFLKLLEYREESNYHFFFSSHDFDYSEIAPGLDGRLEAMFQCVFPYVRNRLVKLNLLASFQTYVGDGIGEDLIGIHVSSQVRHRVFRWLADNQFST